MAAIIIPGQSGTYRHLQGRVTGLLAESGLNRALKHFNAALEYYLPERSERSHTQHGLGEAFFALYEESGDRKYLMQGKAALEEALEVSSTRERRAVYRMLSTISDRIPLPTLLLAMPLSSSRWRRSRSLSAEEDPDGWADEAMMLAQLLVNGHIRGKGEDYEIAIRYLTDTLVLVSGVKRAQALPDWVRPIFRPIGVRDDNTARALDFFREALSLITPARRTRPMVLPASLCCPMYSSA